jgi:uncharacterized membrane protein YeaQ/YmgE (transglycosylase-associated protein family)
MGVNAWPVLGLMFGPVAIKLADNSREELVTNLILGVVGAFTGGVIFTRVFDAFRVNDFNV